MNATDQEAEKQLVRPAPTLWSRAGDTVKVLTLLVILVAVTTVLGRFADVAPARSASQDLSALDPDRSYLSIVADDADLNDPESGIMTNRRKRGRDWERPAQVSYFEGGELVFDTRAGLRAHGQTSRGANQRPSFRLYFRDGYGFKPTRESIFDELATAPGRIVVRRAPPDHSNALAFEISRRAGAIAPAFKSVRAFLNGADLGSYLLTEHVNREGWGMSHFGHENFSMYVHNGESTDAQSRRDHDELIEWVETRPAPLTMSVISTKVDLDSLSRHVFTFMFCATGDWAQGAAVRDNSDANARWFWVHWDLDQSFRWREDPDWERPGIGLMIHDDRNDQLQDVRARIFNRLREEDPEFSEYFTKLLTDVLNHQVDTEFLGSLVDRYSFDVSRQRLRELRAFFEHRPAHLRSEMSQYLHAGPSYEVRVEGPEGIALRIDGYSESTGYEGWYPAGSEITVELDAPDANGFSHWSVNGRRHEGPLLVTQLTEKTAIQAVMQ